MTDTLLPYTTRLRSCRPAPRIEHPTADRVSLALCRDRAVRAERVAHDRQLLIHRPATAATHDLDPTAHTITHMTGRKSTRSRRSEILAHHRSSQRAAISIPQQLPARRPSGHGSAKSRPDFFIKIQIEKAHV